MTAHTVKGEYVFSCDSCPDAITPNSQVDFASAWREASGLGWRAHKVEWGKHEHYCPACHLAMERM